MLVEFLLQIHFYEWNGFWFRHSFEGRLNILLRQTESPSSEHRISHSTTSTIYFPRQGRKSIEVEVSCEIRTVILTFLKDIDIAMKINLQILSPTFRHATISMFLISWRNRVRYKYSIGLEESLMKISIRSLQGLVTTNYLFWIMHQLRVNKLLTRNKNSKKN